MKRSKLLSYRGKRHLPLPTGRYVVGCADIMTSYLKTGSFLRLFYPSEECGTNEHYLQWPKWIPSKEYINGSAIWAGIGQGIFRMMHSLFVGDVYIPALWQAPLSQDKDAYPVIVFSHGLGGWRNTYSAMCLEFASHGYVVAAVEHRDHSACASFYLKQPRMSTYGAFPGSHLSDLDDVLKTNSDSEWEDAVDGNWDPKPIPQAVGPPLYIKEWIYYHKVSERESKTVRYQQVRKRAEECVQALDVLESLNNGTFSSNVLDQNFRLDSFRDRLDLSQAAVAGHSFGGASAILSLAVEVRFRVGIALDPWMFPLLSDQGSFSLIQQPLLTINTDGFQDAEALEALKLLQSSETERSFLSIKNARHRDQTDLPFIGRALLPYLTRASCQINRFTVHDLTSQLMLEFLGKHLDIAFSTEGREFLSQKKNHLKELF